MQGFLKGSEDKDSVYGNALKQGLNNSESILITGENVNL
jgi:hypothetical protein